MNRTGLVLRALGLLLSAEGFFAATWMQVGLVWLEALLGLWLLAGAGSLLAWSAACLVFTSFAIVSATQGLIGQASCGCFGRVALNPWYAFGLDIGTLVALAASLPPRPRGIVAELQESLHRLPSALGKPLGIGASGLALAGGFAAVAAFQFGSLPAALAHIRGERLSVLPAPVDVGVGHPGEVRALTVELRNWTDQPIQVIGGDGGCFCAVAVSLPVTVPPGEAINVTLHVEFPPVEGSIVRRAFFFTDDARQPVVPFRLSGRCAESAASD